MNRRIFLSNAIGIPLILQLPLESIDQKISFGLVADPHKDLLHDVDERMRKFIDFSNTHSTDFNIQLGDFCFPKKENKGFLKIWETYKSPKYHVLGNHDMDVSSKEETIDYWGMKSKYYSFDEKRYHFVVLDANYINQDGKYTDYDHANFYIDSSLRTWVDPEQLEWLTADLAATKKPTIIFSHQSLVHDLWGVKNRTTIQKIFEASNKAGTAKVIACFNGHNHIDTYRKINGIYYIDINSMSYQWLGSKYQSFDRYPKSIYDKYPQLANMATYQDSLFAKVSISENILKIEGRNSAYVGSTPQELGLTDEVYGVKYTADISSREFDIQ